MAIKSNLILTMNKDSVIEDFYLITNEIVFEISEKICKVRKNKDELKSQK